MCPIEFAQAPGIPGAPEETIFGMIARWHRLSGNRSAGDTLHELFDTSRILPANAFAGHLDRLMGRLGFEEHSFPAQVAAHTILPYWKPFVDADRYTAALASLRQSPALGMKLSLGLVSSRLGASNPLRYCDECAALDRLSLGVPTWHRVHQLPGVLMCPFHSVALFESEDLSQRGVRDYALFLPDDTPVRFAQRARELPAGSRNSLVRFARLSASLLERAMHPLPARTTLRARYLEHLGRHDLTASPTRVRFAGLQNAIRNDWSMLTGVEPFAALLASLDNEHGWLPSLARKRPGAHHPLKHLLLIGSIAPSINTFFSDAAMASDVSRTERDGRTALHSSLTEQAITLLQDGSHSARQTARALNVDIHTILTIAHRRGIAINRRPKRIFAACHAEIRFRLARGEALSSIAKRAGVAAITVSRVLARDPELQRTRRQAQMDGQRERARKAYLAVKNRYPHESATDLRRRISASYKWLYRHDHTWLIGQQPAARAPVVHNPGGVDWIARDTDLALAMRTAANAILHSPDEPVRISARELGRRTGRISWLNKHLPKLPLCQMVLRDVTETVAAFQARRLQWWEQHLTDQDGLPPAPSRMHRLAGVPKTHPHDVVHGRSR